MKLDLKSALMGLVAGAIVTFTIGAEFSPAQPQVGRYQCSNGARFLQIVDTATGQSWVAEPLGITISGAPAGFYEKKLKE